MFCAFCRTSHPQGARFCWHCGSALTQDQAAWSNQNVLSPTPTPASNYHQQQLQYQAQSPPPVQYQGQTAPQPQTTQYQGQASPQQQAIQYRGPTSPQQQPIQYQGQTPAQQPTHSQIQTSPQPQAVQYQGQTAPYQQPQYQGQTSPPPQYQEKTAPPPIQYQSQPQQAQAGQQQLTLQQYANNTNLQDQKGPGPQIVKAEESTLLLGPKGEMLPALDRVARVIFDKLDQTVEPKNTGRIEPSKFTAFRRYCGLQIPMFYEDTMLPRYFLAIGIETSVGAPNKKPGATFFGYKTMIRHRIMVDPDVAYVSWSKGIKAMGITEFVLKREDFPSLPFQQAVTKENKFIDDWKAEANRDAKAIGTIASIFFGLN